MYNMTEKAVNGMGGAGDTGKPSQKRTGSFHNSDKSGFTWTTVLAHVKVGQLVICPVPIL